MDKSIEQLKEVLRKENQMYKQVLQIAQLKTEAIISGNIETLENITKQEQQYILTMETFEKLRRSVFIALVKKLKIEEIDSISELILFLQEDMGQKIDQLRNDLLQTIADLKETNKKNEQLLKQNLQYINFNLEILTKPSEDDNRYSKKAGEQREVKPINFFDMKV